MENRYNELLISFNRLDIEDKKEEVLKNTLELLKLLYKVNNKLDSSNEALPVFNKYEDDEEYFNQLFSYVISLKEENAKIVKKLLDDN